MQNEKWVEPEIEVITFEGVDILTTSGIPGGIPGGIPSDSTGGGLGEDDE